MSNGRFKKKESKFTQISNTVLTDTNLSFKAIGLYCKINHYITIPNFDLYKAFLVKNSKEGQKAFENAWKELKDSGYLIQTRHKDPKTGVFYWEYELLDEPIIVENPDIPKGGYGESGHGERGVYNNTDLNNTKNNNINNTTTTQTDVVVDNLTTKITSTLKANIKLSTVEKLISEVGVERVEFYIDNWDRFKYTQKTNIIGFFIKAIVNEYDLPTEQEKSVKTDSVEQVNNFKQREYDEDEFEQYYSNK